MADERAEPQGRQVAPGLTVADLVRFHSRPPTPPGWRFEPSVPYHTPVGRRPLVLHLYRPLHGTTDRPAVLFLHGGGWTRGHPFAHIRRAAALAARGWVAATATYRRASEDPWPAQLEDANAALGFLRANATSLDLDPGRIAVAGDSAGGQLAARLALDPGAAVRAAVLWYPVTDLDATPALEPHIEVLTRGDARLRSDASPIRHLHGSAPPVLTFAGAVDPLVPIDSIRAFHRALDGAAVTNRLIEYPHAGHSFDFLPDLWTETFEAATGFLGACFGERTPTAITDTRPDQGQPHR